MKRTHFIAIIIVTALTWAIMTLALGFPTEWIAALKPFITAITVTGAAYWVLEKHAWHWTIFRRWFVDIPDMRGLWNVTLVSSWINPETKEGVPPIQAYAVIRQTMLTVSVRLYTKESESISIAYSIKKNDEDLYDFSTVYQNVPKLNLRDTRSPIHYGAFLMQAHSFKPSEIRGNYWTDRKTTGEIIFKDPINKRPASFDEAAKEYSK